MGSLSSPVVTSCRRSALTCHGQTTKGGNLSAANLGAKHYNFAMKLTICSYSKALLPSTVVNNGQRSDFVGQNFLYFLFNANISIAAAVAGDSDDSDVVAGDASCVSSSSLLLLSTLSHNASV